jgi:hypothetical protein
MERPLRPIGFIGLATVAFAIATTVASPRVMGPLPDGLKTPVLALEIAQSVDEIEMMFGAAGSPERAAWVSGMRAGTYFDFGLVTFYALLLAGVARRLLPALSEVSRARELASTALRRTRVASTLAIAAAVLDVLENRELLTILSGVEAGTRDYGPAVLRLQWLVWPKWIALSAWFVALAPELMHARGALRVAGIAGSLGALACVLAAMQRGVWSEAMALGIAVGMVALIPGCLRKLPS